MQDQERASAVRSGEASFFGKNPPDCDLESKSSRACRAGKIHWSTRFKRLSQGAQDFVKAWIWAVKSVRSMLSRLTVVKRMGRVAGFSKLQLAQALLLMNPEERLDAAGLGV